MTLADIALLALDRARYNRGVSIFQWGLTLVGLSILGIGAYMLLEKPKDAQSTIPVAQKVLGAILCVGGAATVAYAWMGFSKI